MRSIASVIDARLPTRIALAAGAAVIWAATPLVARAMHLSASLVPAAVSATAGWFALVVLAVTVSEVVEIVRRGPDILLAKHERHNWSRWWIPPALLVAGILIGWWLFT